MINDTLHRPVLFFDGECNLCNGLVQFIIRHDVAGKFLFAPLQSATGRDAMKRLAATGAPPDSVVLLYRGIYHTRSAAALHTARLLGGFWKVFYAGIIIPPFIRDSIYNFIAARRYKWFGKRATCMIPTPDLQQRFISS